MYNYLNVNQTIENENKTKEESIILGRGSMISLYKNNINYPSINYIPTMENKPLNYDKNSVFYTLGNQLMSPKEDKKLSFRDSIAYHKSKQLSLVDTKGNEINKIINKMNQEYSLINPPIKLKRKSDKELISEINSKNSDSTKFSTISNKNPNNSEFFRNYSLCSKNDLKSPTSLKLKEGFNQSKEFLSIINDLNKDKKSEIEDQKSIGLISNKKNKLPLLKINDKYSLSSKFSSKSKMKLKINLKPKQKRDWWLLAKNFFNICVFMNTAKNYVKKCKNERKKEIKHVTKKLPKYKYKLKDFSLKLLINFWIYFNKYTKINIIIKEKESKNKKIAKSNVLTNLIKLLINSLINSNNNIPKKINTIIYKYISEGTYFPSNYLSKYIINRLDFDYYGAVINLNERQSGMLLSYLIFIKIICQEILFNLEDTFFEFENNIYAIELGKYLGSILYYITKQAFCEKIKEFNLVIPLLNYYRNYHEERGDLKLINIINKIPLKLTNKTYIHQEYIENLLPEKTFKDFFNIQQDFIDDCKNRIYEWAINFAQQVIEREESSENSSMILSDEISNELINKKIVNRKANPQKMDIIPEINSVNYESDFKYTKNDKEEKDEVDYDDEFED